jgi:hypothetical protein
MTSLTCDELRAMAAEVALGILSGSERADALGHMEHCVGCRVLVEGLAQTGDSLLLLAPEAEPPLGFESGVMSRLAEGEPHQPEPVDAPPETGRIDNPQDAGTTEERRVPDLRPVPDASADRSGPPGRSARRARTLRRRRAVVAIAAAATVLVGGTAAAVSLVDHSGSTSHQTVADQTPLRSGMLKDGSGTPVGHLYAYSGNPSWVFMDLDAGGANGVFTCELQMANGTTVPVGQFTVQNGVGEWAHTIAVNVDQIKGARVVTPDGLTLATAAVS